MNKKPILSICIPTYNRSGKVLEITHAIFDTKMEVEIVVVDNCSEYVHIEQLKTINNPNFKLVLREKNIGSTINIVDAFSYSSGIFSLLCLDKDYINVEYLGEFVEMLKANPGLTYGQCALNITNAKPHKLFEKGFRTLVTKGYDCHHPTGFFANNKQLRDIGVVKRILDNNLNFPFNVDIIKAHLIMLGRGYYVNLPLMATETNEEAANERSHTYLGDDIWFFPHNITLRMITFAMDAITLDLTQKQKRKIISKLYTANLYGATFGYRQIMSNDYLCAHHGIYSKKVLIRQMIVEKYKFAKLFLTSNLPISKIWRLAIILFAEAKWSVKIIIHK